MKTHDAVEMGRRLAMIWSKVMIRRDYASHCVIDHRGTSHTIGSSMPNSTRYTAILMADHIKHEAGIEEFYTKYPECRRG